jgi:hypothetical protein
MPRNEERTVSDVLQDIFANLQDIVRSEVRLAKAEIQTEVSRTATASKPLMIGAVLGIYAGALLLLAAVYGLSLWLKPWIAALLVGVTVAVAAVILIGTGRARLRIVHPTSRKPSRS